MAKRVPDGHGRSFGSWPWQKGCLMVMADPSDLGHGNNRAWLGLRAGIKVWLRSADVIVMPPEEKSRDT